MPYIIVQLSSEEFDALGAVFDKPHKYVEDLAKERASQIIQDMAMMQKEAKGLPPDIDLDPKELAKQFLKEKYDQQPG